MSKPVFDIVWRDELPTLKSVIEAHELRARKALGQNFILDTRITDRIAMAAGDCRGAHLIEIGPGPGGLTRSLLSTGADLVTAIEFDPRAIIALDHLKVAAGPRFQLLQNDALAMNWSEFLSIHPRNIIVANLPYNISTTLLINWLKVIADTPGAIDRMVLMFQKEVADRLVSGPSTPDYGRLSVLTQWLCQTDVEMTLPPGAFVPPPKIFSSVVSFVPKRPRGDAVSWSVLDGLLHDAFLHRRKMLRSNLKTILPLLEVNGIDPTTRAQDVTVAAYLNLARQMENL